VIDVGCAVGVLVAVALAGGVLVAVFVAVGVWLGVAVALGVGVATGVVVLVAVAAGVDVARGAVAVAVAVGGKVAAAVGAVLIRVGVNVGTTVGADAPPLEMTGKKRVNARCNAPSACSGIDSAEWAGKNGHWVVMARRQTNTKTAMRFIKNLSLVR
jgi:hypothetical protein